MTELKIGVTLYNLRDFCKTPGEIAKTLKRVKEIGYNIVQFSGLGPIDAKDLGRMAEGEGLSVCVTHTPYEQIVNDLARVIEDHKIWKCPHVGLGGMPADQRSREGFQRWARVGSEIGRKLKDAGLGLVYHNHSFELEQFEGRTGLDILYGDSDPEVFFAEIDTYWIQHGGGDPAAWIRRMKGRAPVLHFKDMGIIDRTQAMMEVGEGNLNWPAIIEAAKEAESEFCVVEQDTCRRDPFESIAISLRNMKEMGLTA